MPNAQTELPIQPVDKPILCSPYLEPDRHWLYNRSTCSAQQKLAFITQQESDDLPLVYEPDFIVRMRDGLQILLEVKGQAMTETEAKHQAAKRWVSAVNFGYLRFA